MDNKRLLGFLVTFYDLKQLIIILWYRKVNSDLHEYVMLLIIYFFDIIEIISKLKEGEGYVCFTS